jgi:hypothetical protein
VKSIPDLLEHSHGLNYHLHDLSRLIFSSLQSIMPDASPELAAKSDHTADAISSSSHASVPHSLPQPTKIDFHQNLPSTPSSKKPSILKRIWAKLGINGLVVMIMVKPAVAATISMAIYQSPRVAVNYLNLGYLVIIVSITTVPILPRGKFLLNLFLSVVSIFPNGWRTRTAQARRGTITKLAIAFSF